MTAVVLTEMTEDDFAARRRDLVADTARSLAADRGLPAAEAAAAAERETVAALPSGIRTPGHLLRTAVADGRVVGWIWLSLPGTTMPALAWVSEVEVDRPFRSRGLGRAIMEAGEAELAGRGLDRVGLNVHGGNDHALRLYEKLGYEVTRQQRVRVLGVPGPAATAASPVDLVPMKPAEFDRRRADLVRRRAEHRCAYLNESPAAALAAATAAVARALPHGVRTAGALLFTALVDGAEAGWIWASVPSPRRPGMAWLHDVVVDPAHRGHGHAGAMIARIEERLRRAGATSAGLSVPGHDTAARRLCDTLGFAVVSQQMVKDLPPA